jgi:hypothetical protein
VVGASLPMLGVHAVHGCELERGRGRSSGSLEVGVGFPARRVGALPLGVSRGGGDGGKRGEG